MDIKERLLSKISVDETTKCWNWLGALAHGYGRIHYQGETRQAHRVSYELVNEKIPEALVLDHLCENKRCINPDHLEPVTNKLNIYRASTGNSQKTHCPKGHIYDSENTYIDPRGFRNCKACAKERKSKKK